MSLISKDFRLSNKPARKGGIIKLRWVLATVVLTGIGVVIANTGETEYAAQNTDAEAITTTSYPPIEDSAELPTEQLRERFSLSLPKLQGAQPQNSNPQIPTSQKLAPQIQMEAPEIQTRQAINIEASKQIPAAQPAVKPSIVTTSIATTSIAADLQWRDFKVKSGDSLARIFKRANIKPQQLDELMKSGDAVKTLRKIFPEDIIRVSSDANGVLQALRYDINYKSYLMVERNNGTLVARTRSHHIEPRQAHASGIIKSSLFLAAQDAGISQNIIMELAGIFAWDIDFALDIRKGDSFTVLYEKLYRNGEKISYGDILAAKFINNGRVHRAVRYINPQTNRSEFFTPDGRSMRKAFLRTPIKFYRISSHFNPNRRHPVLNTIRAHRGVDYAAKIGTPVFTSGDGKVTFKGVKGGFGKTMVIQHGGNITTLYGHLNSFNRKLRVGSKVKQGQTIAFVGKTGLATGPHLHYEFRVNGVHKNPLTVKLPESNPVPKRFMRDFELTTMPILAQLNLLAQSVQVAQIDAPAMGQKSSTQ